MTIHLSPAEAKALGIVTPTRRRTRGTVPANECLPLRCTTCGAVLPRPVDSDRHLAEHPDHNRYEAVLA